MRHDPDHADEGGEIDENLAFLTVEDVKELHEALIRQFSPRESLTLLDAGRLESAVMAPQQSFGGNYLYQSLAEMATAYLIGLALNHPFENGNKRVAFAACSMFLRMNGYRLTLTQDEAVELTLNVVNRHWDRDKACQVIEDGMAEL
jgi:death on curing protein